MFPVILRVLPATALLRPLLAAALLPGLLPAQTFNPRSYWTFDGQQPMKDQFSQFDLDPAFYQSGYAIQANAAGTGVGKYMTLDATGNIIRAGQLAIDSAFTIEFMFRPGYAFAETRFFYRLDDAITIRMGYPYILFQTVIRTPSGSTSVDDLRVSLDGIGRKTYGYFIDGGWHHLAFKFNANTGTKEIWVDGQLPDGFAKTAATGMFPNTSSVNRDLIINTNTAYHKYYGDYDEIAVYPYELPAKLIHRHYLDVAANGHYTFTNTTLPVPPADPVSGPVDLYEYPPGHPSVTLPVTDQLNTFPVPRYAPGHTLLPNFNWMDPMYLSGRFQPYMTDAQSVDASADIQTILARDFNYMLFVANNANPWTDKWIFLANQNPQWKLSTILLRAQLPNVKAWSQSLPADHYLQDAGGQFIDANGNPTSNKIWRPSAPVTNYLTDGKDMLTLINTNLAGKLTRPVDFVNENGEIFPLISNTAMAKDPQVAAAKNASGLDWENYLASRYAVHATVPYRDRFLGNSPAFNAGTRYSEYRIDGHRDWQFRYEQSRTINTPINGKPYSTLDFYVRWPGNWRYWQGPWHGWQWVVESRRYELGLGDSLFSPFVAAGWDKNAEVDVRPAQWLGLLKCLNMMGAEFFYTGYFNEAASYMPPNPPPNDPRSYIWQAVMPSYAQGIASRYEELLRHGALLEGDVLSDPYNASSFKAYRFHTGDPRQVVVVRKDRGRNRYAITGTLQPNSNMAGNAEAERPATITLDGQKVTFMVRRQGSTYIYDRATAGSPVFYQLDGWHEASHPYRWSQDFILEAELFDNATAPAQVRTEVPAGTPAGDYAAFTSYIAFPSVSDVVYGFQPRGTARDYYFWVRARSRNGGTTGMAITLDGTVVHNMECITDTAWTWYRYDRTNTAIGYPLLSVGNHTLRITPLNTALEIDVIAFLTSSGPAYGNAAPPCSTGAATITPSGSTTFCQGGSVTLTASAGASYLWSTGATTKSITVTASGSYTVAVDGVASSSVQVVVNPLPAATVTPSGPVGLCPGTTATLTAATAASYLWTPGNQTTKAITVTAAGNYAVRVTDNNGCTRLSAAVTVNALSAPASTVMAGGPTTFCSGDSVILSAAGGAAAFLWSPNGETTAAVTATASASYQVQVTGSNGCTASSSPVAVTANKNPQAFISANGSLLFVQGDSVVLTATQAAAYAWSPGGQTTASITVYASGTFQVVITDANGCTGMSAPATTFVSQSTSPAIAVSGPTTFCDGGSVVLTAPAGTGYQWSTGATGSSITVQSSGLYSVTVYTGTGSFNPQPVQVTVNPVPSATITAGGPTSFCSGGSVVLQANAANSWLWLPGGETTQSITVTSPGTYSVRTTNMYGCTALSAPVAVSWSTSCPCSVPTGLFNSSVSAGQATLNWAPVAGADSLQVFLFRIFPSRKTIFLPPFAGTFTQVTVGVLPNAWYYWKVRALCSGSWGNWSAHEWLSTPALKAAAGPVRQDDGGATEGTERQAAGAAVVPRPLNLLLFPNPAHEVLQCVFTSTYGGAGMVFVRDLAGKVVMRQDVAVLAGENSIALAVGALAPGLYILELAEADEAAREKFMVQ